MSCTNSLTTSGHRSHTPRAVIVCKSKRCGLLTHGAAPGVESGRLVSGKPFFFAGFENAVNIVRTAEP